MHTQAFLAHADSHEASMPPVSVFSLSSPTPKQPIDPYSFSCAPDARSAPGKFHDSMSWRSTSTPAVANVNAGAAEGLQAAGFHQLEPVVDHVAEVGAKVDTTKTTTTTQESLYKYLNKPINTSNTHPNTRCSIDGRRFVESLSHSVSSFYFDRWGLLCAFCIGSFCGARV
jgi:hypothetical protein